MRNRKCALSLGVILISAIVAGCSLPIQPTPTEIAFPTPNLTLTAIFAPPQLVTPTTAAPAVQTATLAPVATATEAPTLTPPAVIPTNTIAAPAATQTPAPVSGPSGPSSKATFLSTAPKIDGVWDDWTTTQYPIKGVVFGKKNWEGSDDLEGAYRIGWDTNFLYLAVKVTDDQYVQLSTGANLYKGDSLELLLDSNLAGDLGNRSLTVDDFQIGISPGKGTPGHNPEAFGWFPRSKAGSLTGVKIASVSGDALYRVEAAIPWTVLGVTPASGQQYGFAVSISDDDNSNEAVQQSMVSNDPNRVLTDPTTWGTLTLVK